MLTLVDLMRLVACVRTVQESLHFEKVSKGEALRSGYRRAVTTPNNKIEELWARYSTYEYTLNAGTVGARRAVERRKGGAP